MNPRRALQIIPLLFCFAMNDAAASDIKGTYKQIDVTCAQGDLTSLGKANQAAVKDGRIIYAMKVLEDKSHTVVKVWTDLKKKTDYCELTTDESWKAGQKPNSLVISNSHLVRKPHGKDDCTGSYDRPEERTLTYEITDSEMRLQMPADAREMMSNDKPEEGFCEQGGPVLIFKKEGGGLFKPI